MTKNFAVVAIGVLVATLILGPGVSSCNSKQVNIKIGELNESLKEHAQENAKLQEEIGKLAQQNEALLEANKKLDVKIQQTEKKILDGVKKAEQQAADRPEFPKECKEIVDHMQTEIDSWKANFSLAIVDRDDWKAKSNNFELAFNNQVQQTAKIQLILANVTYDSNKKTEVIKELQKSLSFKKWEKALYITAIVVIGSALIYGFAGK